jgi:divalent metal cation (Fe/Co/Zn/Cd) transporter
MRPTLQFAVLLLVLTALYNIGEGVLAIVSGVEAQSLTLLAFGADSYLEVVAAGAVLWRLSYRDEEAGERAEQRARRIIGATFLLLAGAVTIQSTVALAGRAAAESSPLGLALLATSLVLMPLLSLAKLWTAARANLPALAAEARLVAVALAGWWWLDAVAALLLVPWLVREGLEGVRGDACFEGIRACFCRPCFLGVRACAGSCCAPVCC